MVTMPVLWDTQPAGVASMPEVGDMAPDFTLPSTSGEISLVGLGQGRKLVVAFYIEDKTPG